MASLNQYLNDLNLFSKDKSKLVKIVANWGHSRWKGLKLQEIRVKTDLREKIQEDSSMDLASRMIWRSGCPMKLDTSNFSVKSQNAVLIFAI